VIGLVGAATGEPLAMGERDEDLGLVDTDRAGDLATQRQAVLDHAVVEVEELHGLDADLGRAVAFLPGTQRCRLARWDPIYAGVAVGGQQIADRLALLHPVVDSSGDAVLEIIGVSGHAERSRPGLVQRRQALLLRKKVAHRGHVTQGCAVAVVGHPAGRR
jgi:hypothetical protein